MQWPCSLGHTDLLLIIIIPSLQAALLLLPSSSHFLNKLFPSLHSHSLPPLTLQRKWGKLQLDSVCKHRLSSLWINAAEGRRVIVAADWWEMTKVGTSAHSLADVMGSLTEAWRRKNACIRHSYRLALKWTSPSNLSRYPKLLIFNNAGFWYENWL